MLLDDGREIKLTKTTGLFFLEVKYQNAVNQSTCNKTRQTIKGDINLWHKRLGHLKKTDVKRTVVSEGDSKDTCETCAMGKQASQEILKKFKIKRRKALELVYSDVLSPEVATLNGSKSVVSFIDEYTKYVVVKFMSNRSQVLDKFKEYVAGNETPRTLRTVNGAEHTSNKFKEFC